MDKFPEMIINEQAFFLFILLSSKYKSFFYIKFRGTKSILF